MEREKRAFDIDLAIQSVREAVLPLPKAAQFQLADEGYVSVFEQLLACILSTRTLDEISIECARSLFRIGRTAQEIASLDISKIDAAISACRFHETKAQEILSIARETMERYQAGLPCDAAVLMSFKGVGPKCANLVLNAACGQACIAVDTHVHQVTNRWGIISTKTPEQSMHALEQVLSKRYWGELNSLLVPFGKHVCTPRLPRCSTCPVLSLCRQVGVEKYR